MTSNNTFNNRRKVDHQTLLCQGVLDRLVQGSKSRQFRGGVIYFSVDNKKETFGKKKYGLLDDIKIKDAVAQAGGNSTAIARTLESAREIIEDYLSDKSLPKNKGISLFLFSDGQENVQKKKDVEKVASQLKSKYDVSIPDTKKKGSVLKIATVSFGKDADKNLLMSIASKPTDRQLSHLNSAGVLQHLPNKDKLFIEGHVKGKITKQKVEAIRNFVTTLSETA